MDNPISTLSSLLKAGGKKDISKLVKKNVVNRRGRRQTVYVLPAGKPKEKSRSHADYLELLMSLFGLRKKTDAVLLPSREYERNNVKEKFPDLTKAVFTAHFKEYFSNKEKYDKMFSGKKKKGTVKGGGGVKGKKKGTGGGGIKGKGGGEKKYNMAVMKYLHELYGGKKPVTQEGGQQAQVARPETGKGVEKPAPVGEEIGTPGEEHIIELESDESGADELASMLEEEESAKEESGKGEGLSLGEQSRRFRELLDIVFDAKGSITEKYSKKKDESIIRSGFDKLSKEQKDTFDEWLTKIKNPASLVQGSQFNRFMFFVKQSVVDEKEAEEEAEVKFKEQRLRNSNDIIVDGLTDEQKKKIAKITARDSVHNDSEYIKAFWSQFGDFTPEETIHLHAILAVAMGENGKVPMTGKMSARYLNAFKMNNPTVYPLLHKDSLKYSGSVVLNDKGRAFVKDLVRKVLNANPEQIDNPVVGRKEGAASIGELDLAKPVGLARVTSSKGAVKREERHSFVNFEKLGDTISALKPANLVTDEKSFEKDNVNYQLSKGGEDSGWITDSRYLLKMDDKNKTKKIYEKNRQVYHDYLLKNGYTATQATNKLNEAVDKKFPDINVVVPSKEKFKTDYNPAIVLGGVKYEPLIRTGNRIKKDDEDNEYDFSTVAIGGHEDGSFNIYNADLIHTIMNYYPNAKMFVTKNGGLNPVAFMDNKEIVGLAMPVTETSASRAAGKKEKTTIGLLYDILKNPDQYSILRKDLVVKASIYIGSDGLLKAFGHKDISKLVKKQITNKKGQKQTVYVQMDKKTQAKMNKKKLKTDPRVKEAKKGLAGIHREKIKSALKRFVSALTEVYSGHGGSEEVARGMEEQGQIAGKELTARKRLAETKKNVKKEQESASKKG